MKLKSCFLIMLMVCAFFSCSDNDEPVNLTITPVVPDATLSMAVQTDGVKTKGGFIEDDNNIPSWDKLVKTLTLVVFNNDGGGANSESGIPVGKIVNVVTVDYFGKGILETAPVIEQANLVSGKAYLLLIANLPKGGIDRLVASANSLNSGDRLTFEEVLQMTTDLKDEGKDKGLTMSSDLIPVEIVPGINYVGFAQKTGEVTPLNRETGTEIYGKGPVELVRTVAAIYLEGIILPEKPDAKKPEYTSLRFHLKSVFAANVKSTAGLGSAGNVKIEQSALNDGQLNTSYYLAPEDYANLTGSLKTGSAKGDNTMLRELTEVQAFPATERADENNMTLAWVNKLGDKSYVAPCYVYPNQNGETGVDGKKNYTLLVIKGDYSYSINGKEELENDRYYAVIVNDNSLGGTIIGGEGKVDVRVERNTKYHIKLQILGSGSATPFDPPAFAHVAAQVEVADWNVINIDQPVD